MPDQQSSAEKPTQGVWYAAMSIQRTSATVGGRRNPFGAGFSYDMHNVQVLALAPNSTHVAFSWYDKYIQVTELREDGSSFLYHGHHDPVQTLAWSPDSRSIASASGNEQVDSVQVWDVATQHLLTTYTQHTAQIMSLCWSPDGQRIASGSWDTSIHIWEATTGKTLVRLTDAASFIRALAWSPDGRYLASGSLEGTVHIWDIAPTARLLTTYYGHFGGVNALAWSADGALLASGGDDVTVQVWRPMTKELLFTYRYHSKRITALDWSADGTRIRSGAWDNTFREWDALTGENVFLFHPPTVRDEGVHTLCWTPDVSMIACGDEDRRVIVADMKRGKLLICRGPSIPIELVGQALAEQEQAVAQPQVMTNMHPIQVWGAAARPIVYMNHAGAVKALAWSPDSTRIVSGGYDTTVQVWATDTGASHATYAGHSDPVMTVAWSPDGRFIASGSIDATVRIWDVASGQALLTYNGHTDTVLSVCWSPDSTTLASASQDRTVHLWNAATGQLLRSYTEHTEPVQTVSWSPDGRFIASGGDDKTVHVWEATSGQDTFVYRGHEGNVLSVAWSPDGTRIASGSDWSWNEETMTRTTASSMHIWNVAGHVVLCEQRGHPVHVYAISWSPNGAYVASGDLFHRIEVYDAITGTEVAQVQDHVQDRGRSVRRGEILGIAWSPDGTRIAAAFSSGEARIWPTHPAHS